MCRSVLVVAGRIFHTRLNLAVASLAGRVSVEPAKALTSAALRTRGRGHTTFDTGAWNTGCDHGCANVTAGSRSVTTTGVKSAGATPT